jgi:hypothetical protein
MPACTFKLMAMSGKKADRDLDCPRKERDRQVKGDEPPYARFRYTGCGNFVEYKGTCDATRSGCDVVNRQPGCDGGCRLERVDSGPAPLDEKYAADGDDQD